MGRHESALFLRMALIEEPFQRAVTHLVGPLPVTKDGLGYILTRIKSMLRKVTDNSPTDSNRNVSAALFLYRQQIHASSGFS
ncbi:hypothetical protein RRG08_047335 [Elysia crispata]|uniref:Uncharacterized protein n=1 Tax=Elysia crispata TaxID=231223 RepID=A0AAE1B0P1_9GAST|nr:hypothetical protein RRG08_047335 [Elysia crispata]